MKSLTFQDLKPTNRFLTGCVIILLIGIFTNIFYSLSALGLFILMEIIGIYVERNSQSNEEANKN